MRRLVFFILILSQINGQYVSNSGEISILGLRVSFPIDEDESTTGNGTFLTDLISTKCENYFLDPPPHDNTYFFAQLKAVDNYFRSVSKGDFGLDLTASRIMPDDSLNSYTLDSTMLYFHPYGDQELQDQRLAEFFKVSLLKAYETDVLNFDEFDVIVIFHAGIGQDFVLPFLDPTPEDIPSAYIDPDFLLETLGIDRIVFDNDSYVSSGIVLPETQNHLLYEIADDIFIGVSNPCDYQFGLTGTFALMVGFAIGLPPLWDTESGESGAGVFTLMDQGSNNGRGIIPAPPDAWIRTYAGWESETVLRPTQQVELVARDSLEDQIVRIDINESEYFLIENRNNWLFQGVDIDSLRWRNRDAENVMPSYIEMLMDSGGVEIDSSTGVILSIPNYDQGLPGSGLLIWHIDHQKIWEGLNSYSVNIEREHRGIDLEEADGAQDIGYPSNFIFTDPSSGLWSDIWFTGNSEYYFANPGFVHLPPSFGPDTYPNTGSYSGSDSYIEINNISKAGKIMSFTVENTLMADGFPDTSLNIHFFYDFTGDDMPEIIGGSDSLWWSPADSLKPQTFFHPANDNFLLCVTNKKNLPHLAVAEEVEDSIRVSLFKKINETQTFELVWSLTVSASFPTRIYGLDETPTIVLDFVSSWVEVSEDSILWFDPQGSPDQPLDSLFEVTKASWSIEDKTTSKIDSGYVGALTEGGFSVRSGATHTSGFHDIKFSSMAVADVDLNGRVEIIAIDKEGSVYIFNQNFTLESGFPILIQAITPPLVRDLFGDSHPEIVVQVESGDLVISGWQGEEIYRLANSRRNHLQMLSQYQGKNCIITESAIWQFDTFTPTDGNEWSYRYQDPTNRRTLTASLQLRTLDEVILIDPERTYNYPNPVKDGTTTIRIFVESADKVEVMIYDIAGFFVEKMDLDIPNQGEVNEITWDVSNVQSGVYFANIQATKATEMESKILKIVVVH